MVASSFPRAVRTGASRRVAFPPERRLVLDTLHLGRRKPMMHGLLEIDVTRARRRIREQRERTGQSLSFTAFVLACLGRAVAAHPEVHALRDWLGRVVMFDDVDATTIIEVAVEGRPFAMAHVVRGINRRGVGDISDEIRGVQGAGVRSLSPGMRAGSAVLLRLPGIVRRSIFGALLGFPQFAKRNTGTLLVSAVGMFGRGIGWGWSAPGVHNLSIVVGGISSRRSPLAGETETREVLCLTVSANHETVDGAPLARFVSRLKESIESAELLAEATPNHTGDSVPVP